MADRDDAILYFYVQLENKRVSRRGAGIAPNCRQATVAALMLNLAMGRH